MKKVLGRYLCVRCQLKDKSNGYMRIEEFDFFREKYFKELQW